MVCAFAAMLTESVHVTVESCAGRGFFFWSKLWPADGISPVLHRRTAVSHQSESRLRCQHSPKLGMLKACIRLYKPLCRCRHSAVLPAASSVPVRPVKDSQEPQQLTQSAQFVLPRSWSSAVPQQRVRISRTSGHALRATAGVEHQCNDSHAEPQQQPQRVTVYFGADGVYTTAEPAENLWAVRQVLRTQACIPRQDRCSRCRTCS